MQEGSNIGQDRDVTTKKWVTLTFSAHVPAVDLLFRIDDLNPKKVPSALYLRDLRIIEDI
jgi:hypothetical protein